MELHICTIGRWRKAQQDIATGLLNQMRPLAQSLNLGPLVIHTIRADTSRNAAQRRAADTARLIKQLPANQLCIALDKGGQQYTSTQFAKQLQNWANCGKANLCFVIGGPDGLAKNFLAQADGCLSLGPLLWSHEMVRLMILEQLWRALALVCHHPYAKK